MKTAYIKNDVLFISKECAQGSVLFLEFVAHSATHDFSVFDKDFYLAVISTTREFLAGAMNYINNNC